ncbi:MAG: acyltransferase [Lachnospiraceae bacterium]|nr:acyltransferase [Lachnospiraceae bacterium]
MKILKELTYTKILRVILLIMFAALFFVGLAYTGINLNTSNEALILNGNNVLYMSFWILVLTAALKGLGILYDKFLYKIPAAAITGFFCLVMYAISAAWIFAANVYPTADAEILIEIAENINNHIQQPFAPNDYLTFFPYQLGFVTVLRMIHKVFGDGNFKAYQMVLAVSVIIIVASGSGIIKHIAPKDKASKLRFLYCIFMLFCLPLYFYTPMIYGDLLYAGLTMFSIYMVCECVNNPKIYKFIIIFCACGLNYLVKTNALIVTAAILIFLTIGLLKKEKRILSAILILVVLAGTFIPTAINNAIYKDYTNDDFDAIPMIATVGMGLSDTDGMPGWCNFYHQLVFVNNDNDAAITKLAVKSAIKTKMNQFADDPKYAVDFYYRKINYQWNTPTYSCLNMTNSYEPEGQSEFASKFYNEFDYLWKLGQYCKIFQLFVYGVIMLKIFFSIRKKQEEPLLSYLSLIYVFGSFLFSIIWEAKPRYVFPAYLCTIPFAVFCFDQLVEYYENAGIMRIREYLVSEKTEVVGNYVGLDLIKILMAVAVVAIHTLPHVTMIEAGKGHYIEGLIRPAVGFFFLAAGFLLGKKLLKCEAYSEKKKIILDYIKKIFILYVIWNVIYLPLAIYEYVQYNFDLKTAILYYLQGFLFTGEHYNSWILWYLLSSIFACLFMLLLIKINVKESTWIVLSVTAFLVSFFIDYLMSGAYAGKVYDVIRAIVINTIGKGRVLGGLCYIPLGVYFAKKKLSWKTGTLLLLIGYFLSFPAKFEDAPYLLESIGLLMIGVNLNLKGTRIWPFFRKLSTNIYFVHMWVFTVVCLLLYGGMNYGMVPFAYTLPISAVISVLMIFAGKKKWGRS